MKFRRTKLRRTKSVPVFLYIIYLLTCCSFTSFDDYELRDTRIIIALTRCVVVMNEAAQFTPLDSETAIVTKTRLETMLLWCRTEHQVGACFASVWMDNPSRRTVYGLRRWRWTELLHCFVGIDNHKTKQSSSKKYRDVTWHSRHIGGIHSVNKDGVKMQKSDNSYAEVIRKLRISTGVYSRTQLFASALKLSLRCYATNTVYIQNGGLSVVHYTEITSLSRVTPFICDTSTRQRSTLRPRQT